MPNSQLRQRLFQHCHLFLPAQTGKRLGTFQLSSQKQPNPHRAAAAYIFSLDSPYAGWDVYKDGESYLLKSANFRFAFSARDGRGFCGGNVMVEGNFNYSLQEYLLCSFFIMNRVLPLGLFKELNFSTVFFYSLLFFITCHCISCMNFFDEW